MENVSVNMRAVNSKGGKGFGVLHFSHLFTNLINNLPLIQSSLHGRDIADHEDTPLPPSEVRS